MEGPEAERGCYHATPSQMTSVQETKKCSTCGLQEEEERASGEATCSLYFGYLPYARHSAFKCKYWQEDEGALSARRRTPV